MLSWGLYHVNVEGSQANFGGSLYKKYFTNSSILRVCWALRYMTKAPLDFQQLWATLTRTIVVTLEVNGLMHNSASNGRSPTRSMRIELAVSELEINVRRSMCELENMGIGRIGSLKQSLKPKIRCVYTKTNPCYRPANGLVPDMASILCMFSVRTPADSTDGDREFPQYIVFYRRG